MIQPRFFLLIYFILVTAFLGTAWSQEIPLNNPVNQELLRYNESKAKEFVSKNLNRFAVERMQKYDYLLDSLYKRERSDTLASIEKAYLQNTGSKKSTIDKHNKEISELSIEKEKLEKRYWSFVRKSILAFVVWATIVIILLQFRKIRLKRARVKLSSTTIQLLSMEESAKHADKFISDYTKFREPLEKINNEITKLNLILSEGVSKPNVPAGWTDITALSNQLTKTLSTEEKILKSVQAQTELLKEEKISTDINNLCEQYVEIAIRNIHKSEDFNCQVTKDFEKKLPFINVNPTEVGSLLLNILNNAIQSVKEKNDKGIKGYQPKVSISTRILPRFLQIRIKDNGMGMSEDILKNATKEFFSTRPLDEGSGLGLFFANDIISEKHKGEIKIESEEGASTDVYIKFFI